MKQINEKEKDIIQDNADLLELAMRYEYLNIPYKDRRIIDDYIACILSRQERMETLIYYAGRKDALGYCWGMLPYFNKNATCMKLQTDCLWYKIIIVKKWFA